MNREDKIKLAIDKGYTCNPITGEVIGLKGKIITCKSKGYVYIRIKDYDNKHYKLYAHQFIWYDVYNEIVEQIDHINRFKDDNRIENLRSVTNQQNQFNKNHKGYNWSKSNKKWVSRIMVDGKSKLLGFFDTEQEASQAYQDEKKILHRI